MGAVGAAGGVAVGGVIVSALGWQWVFLVNVPIGVLGLLAGTRLLPRDGIDLRAVRRGELDLPGMVTGTGCLLLTVYVATKGAEGLAGPAALAAGGVAVLLGAAFVLAERRAATPVLPFRLFRTRASPARALGTSWSARRMCRSSSSCRCTSRKCTTTAPSGSGLAVLPIALAGIPVARLLIPRALRAVGPRMVLAGGMALLTVALLLLSRIPAHADYAADFLPAAFVFAVGLPACFVGATMPAMRAAAPGETGIVSGVVNTAQRLGAGLGVAVLAAVATSRTTHHGGAPADAVNAGFHLAFLGAATVAALGLLVALASLRELAQGAGPRGPGTPPRACPDGRTRPSWGFHLPWRSQFRYVVAGRAVPRAPWLALCAEVSVFQGLGELRAQPRRRGSNNAPQGAAPQGRGELRAQPRRREKATPQHVAPPGRFQAAGWRGTVARDGSAPASWRRSQAVKSSAQAAYQPAWASWRSHRSALARLREAGGQGAGHPHRGQRVGARVVGAVEHDAVDRAGRLQGPLAAAVLVQRPVDDQRVDHGRRAARRGRPAGQRVAAQLRVQQREVEGRVVDDDRDGCRPSTPRTASAISAATSARGGPRRRRGRC